MTEDFLQNFYSLDALTLAERRKNFFKLLDENALHLKSNVDFLDAVSLNLKPRNHLESLFRVDFLIYFRRKQELLQILKDDNSIFVSKVTKQIWFFKEAFEDVSAKEIVDEILPSMSFSVRMKVLRKLSRYLNNQRFNEIFDCVAGRYGIFIASQFITGCDPLKIRTILVENRVKLNSTQLRILHGKDRELIEFYFKKTNYSIDDCNTFTKYLFNKDRALFDRLQETYKFDFKLGRRSTKKFVDSNKDDIIKDPERFYHIDMKAVIRKLGKESVELFINALPKNFEYCYNETWVLRSFPKRYHYNLYVKTYQTHFNIKLADYPSLISKALLKIIPTNSERAALAKIQIEKGYDQYLPYLLPEESIPLIKEKINFTSDGSYRAHLNKCLVTTCYINKDLESLCSVIKYFCSRHRNDDLNVHLLFIDNIEKLFGCKQFTEEMWNCFNELLGHHMLKFDESEITYQKVQTSALVSCNVGISTNQKLSYLEFLFKNGKSVDQIIREYFNESTKFPSYEKFDKNFTKYLLLFAINNLAKESLDDNDSSFNYDLIKEIDNWNAYYKDDKLSFYDYPILVKYFNHIIRTCDAISYAYTYPHLVKIFREKIFTTKENIYKNEYLQLYFERPDQFFRLKDVRWFLKYEPLTVHKNFEIIFQKLTNLSRQGAAYSILYIFKKYSHLQLDKKFIEIILAKLNDENCLERKVKFIYPLSILMESSEYAALADSYKPENKKLDLKNEREVRLYNLQCAIATQFKNTKTSEVLSSLLNYCAGDYFKYALRSLYSLLYRTPENQLPQYLDYLSKKAVSVRKHALYLTCELSTCTKVENMLTLLHKQEDVQSLRKYMFSSTIKYFVKNPSDSFFELVKLNMLSITKVDEESLGDLAKYLKKIPENYKAPYLVYAWKHLEKTLDIWLKLSSYKDNILYNVNVGNAKSVPLDLGLKIIEQHFMTEKGERDLIHVSDFIYILLLASDEKNVIFQKVFDKINQSEKEEDTFRLFNNWYGRIMESVDNVEFWQPFVDYYEKKTRMIEDFKLFIKVSLMKIKVKYVNLSADDLAEKILNFFEEILSSCGPHVIYLLAVEIHSNLHYFMRSGTRNHNVYYNMLRRRPEAVVANFVLQILSEPQHGEPVKTFYQILKLLNNIDDVGIKINLYWKFKKFLENEPAEVDE